MNYTGRKSEGKTPRATDTCVIMIKQCSCRVRLECRSESFDLPEMKGTRFVFAHFLPLSSRLNNNSEEQEKVEEDRYLSHFSDKQQSILPFPVPRFT